MPEFKTETFAGRKTLVALPDGYDPSKPYPTILFLHGAGESGSDPTVHQNHSLGKALQANPERWPFLVFMPQKSDSSVLWPAYRNLLNSQLRDFDAAYKRDTKHTTLTGLSQGGNATLTLAKSLAWDFAAAAAICGWADPMMARSDLDGVPTWLFHGAKDPVVPASCSQAVFDVLRTRRKGDDYTEFPEADHNSWDAAYALPELPQWLLRHGL